MAGPLTYVDMKLEAKKKPSDLKVLSTPQPISAVIDKHWRFVLEQTQAVKKEKMLRMRFALGKEADIHASGNVGLFDTVHTAWANHWKLRTCPDDWWQPVIRYVAKLIYDASEKYPEGAVKRLFVGNQEGKKQLRVEVGDSVVDTVDFEYVFRKFAEKIEENVKVPQFRKAMEADFNTSGYDHVVGSQITMMSATQNFFEFILMLMGCGIKGVEMMGELEDWKRLRQKFAELVKILEPAKEELDFNRRYLSWIKHVDMVFGQLEDTFQKKASAVDWWPGILVNSKIKKWGPSGVSSKMVSAYDGWLIESLCGRSKLERAAVGKELKGVSTVPMKIIDVPNALEDDSILVAGILGYTVVDKGEGKSATPTIQANHMWSLQLTDDSPFRKNK